MAESVEIKLTAEGEALLKQLHLLDGKAVYVGYQEDAMEEDGTHLAAIAYYNQYGTVHEDGQVAIPARPFMDVLKRDSQVLAAFIEIQLSGVAIGRMSGDAALNRIGQKAVSMVQNEITDGNFEPNAPATLRAKYPKTKPLIDSGTMLDRVSYVIREEGGS